MRTRLPHVLFPFFFFPFFFVILIATGSLQSPRLVSAGASGEGIMRRVNLRPRGEGSRMRLEMSLHDAKRGEFHKTILLERTRLGSAYRTKYKILAPDHEKGITLLLSEDPAQHGMWMFFPISGQVVRVASRGFPALATDFSCEDLLAEVPLNDYSFRVLGDQVLDGTATVQVEMVPRTERLQSELGFAKSVGWVRQDIPVIVRADYYDDQDVLFKTFHAEQIEKVQGVWTVRKWRMQNIRAQHTTEVEVTDIDYSFRLPETVFTPGKLMTGLGKPPT